jgi:gamma-glutamyltranspeptidase/glutathione hydrolase
MSAPASQIDLSPLNWAAGARETAEQIEAQRWAPSETRTISGQNGLISATASPIAVEAGLKALRYGGSAADVAGTIALTQVATQLGAVISYAGIMTMLYYDAKAGEIHALDAGYNSYRGESEPKTIPLSDLGPLNDLWPSPVWERPQGSVDHGRKTLVPGFMAGIQAMHDRFGKLPFSALFEPAIWYAKNGVIISPMLAGYFHLRESVLSRTQEGRDFLRQAGNGRPKPGDRFVQSELAETLTAIANDGAQVMYTGKWGEAFVAALQRAGGKATLDDLRAYRPMWDKPCSGEVFGHIVHLSGPPNRSVHPIMTGLYMTEALGLDKRGAYWSDPTTFRDLSRVCEFVSTAPLFSPWAIDLLQDKGIDVSIEARGTKAFAQGAASLLDELFAPIEPDRPRHSAAIVVVDKDGDIVVMTHTINTVVWGDTGLIVGGIPLPDSAGFQQWRLAQLKPGERVPNEIACTLTFAGKTPVLATAPVGSALIPETLKTIVSAIGQSQDLGPVVAAPPLLLSLPGDGVPGPLRERTVSVPTDAYDAQFLAEVRALGVRIDESSAALALNLRGTLASVSIDPDTGRASGPEVPGIMVFTAAG